LFFFLVNYCDGDLRLALHGLGTFGRHLLFRLLVRGYALTAQNPLVLLAKEGPMSTQPTVASLYALSHP